MKRYTETKFLHVLDWGRKGAVILKYGRWTTFTVHHRDNYSREEAHQVVDWLNGADQPLPRINMSDFPGHPHRG